MQTTARARLSRLPAVNAAPHLENTKMAEHHGLSPLKGLNAFCHLHHRDTSADRFGRLFDLPPLYVRPEHLEAIGAKNGPMDGGTSADRTDSVAVGQVFFGQFIDHDITLDATSSLSAVSTPEDIQNVRTPTLDLDCVYGDGPEATPFLYHGQGQFSGIKLLTGADGTAAPGQSATHAGEDLQRTSHGTAIIGDPRNDENRVISQLQLAMIRFHNKVVDQLHGEGVEDGELFEEARRLTTWHYQWVVIQDFLRTMCGGAVVDDILGRGRRFYCVHNQDPFIPVEFSVAAYRFGHSMIPQRVQLQSAGPSFELFGTVLGLGFKPLSDDRAVVEWAELVGTAPTVQRAEKLDGKLARNLLDLPFVASGDEASLATRNLLRGQAFLLPSGETVAEHIGRPGEEIERVTDAVATQVGGAADLSSGTPLWLYVLVEAGVIGRETSPGDTDEGEGLGPVGAGIVAETLIGLAELDPRSFMANNRAWRPADGVGVGTLAELLAF
jgi:hypothetical protein